MSFLKEKGPDELLKKYNLRNTDCRTRILECFQQFDFALSQGFLEESLHREHDRVTIYRTLKSFLESGLIHKIPDDEGGVKYALCSDDCLGGEHDHSHVHFTCEKCGQTICLENISIPSITIPKDFQVSEVKLLVTGICDKCR